VGGGITWDSTAEGEYDELLAKSVLLSEDWPAFSLIETMRAEDAVVHRLPLHVARLKRSAAYFGFAFDEAHVRNVIERALQSHAQGTWRLRLELDAEGEAAAGFTPIEPLGERPSVAFARRPVASTDRFLFHKTTHREVYESRRAERLDVFDVLLRNERGEVTEFTRGNIVIERDDARWTPPVRCGLLAGTFRQQLLNDGVARERVLYEADVRAATRVWFVNGVREWLEVRLTG
jgi:para-aminobenzoate synthetase/4-amino-4-deoxychorismate lyase